MQAVDEATRLWMRVDKSGDCWLWTGPVEKTGYARLQRSRTSFNVSVHRLSWELHFGEIPKGLFVCHRCDNRVCVRPDHLFLGTARDNVQDMIQKGRQYRVSKPSLVTTRLCNV